MSDRQPEDQDKEKRPAASEDRGSELHPEKIGFSKSTEAFVIGGQTTKQDDPAQKDIDAGQKAGCEYEDPKIRPEPHLASTPTVLTLAVVRAA